jgi:manganese/zinc/iron transport system ATP- binding protein
MLLNMRLVAYGEMEENVTPDLLQKTYGGRLTILSDVAGQAAGRSEFEQEGNPKL